MKVLILENVPAKAHALQQVLDRHFLESVVASTKTETSALLGHYQPTHMRIGIILMGAQFAFNDIVDITNTIRKVPSSADIPIIWMQPETKNHEKAIRQGITDFITEPATSPIAINRIKTYWSQYTELKDTQESYALLNSSFEEVRQISVALNEQNELQEENERRIKDSEKRFKLAVQSANAGLFHYDLNSDTTTWDERSYRIFGLHTLELQNAYFTNDYASWSKRIHPEDAGHTERKFMQWLESNEEYLKINYRIIKPDGSEGFVMTSCAAERLSDHSPLHIFGLHLDLSENYEAEQALIQSEEQYKHLTETLHEIVWTMDLNGNITYLNPAFMRVFGREYTINNYPKIEDLFTEKSLDLIYKGIKRGLTIAEVMGTNKPTLLPFELEGKHYDGRTIFLETSADFTHNKSNRIIAIQGVMRDITDRKLRENQLEEYKNNLEKIVEKRTRELDDYRRELRLVFDHAPVTMLLLNERFEVVDVNVTGIRFLGRSFGELRSKRFGEAFRCINIQSNTRACGTTHACKNCEIDFLFNNAINKERDSTKVELKIRITKKGLFNIHTVNISTTTLHTHMERYILVTIDDITQQKNMQEALLESERKYRKLFETKHEAVLLMDASTSKYFDVNDAACDLYEYTKHEMLQLTPMDISLDQESTQNALQKLINEDLDKLVINTRMAKTKTGKTVIVEVQNSTFTLKGQKIIYSTHRNITERHNALEKLKESEHTFRMLVENIDEIFWVFEANSQKLAYISPQREKLTGLKPNDLLSDYKSMLQETHPADRQKLEEAFPLIMAGQQLSIEYRVITKNNNLKWFTLRSLGLFEDNKGEKRIFGLASDITEQKQSERRILHAILETENRERESFAKEVHDGLGANLSSIKMSLERLKENSLKPERKEFYIKHALDLIGQAALTTREISNNLKPHTLVNLGIIPSIEQLCYNINELGGMQVNFNYTHREIGFDKEIEHAIYRIMGELLNNSLKYAAAPTAHINMYTKNEKLIVEYRDTGKGFDLDTAIKDKGSGLKNITARIKACGGTIKVDSAVSQGMTALLQIPIYD